MDNIMMDTVASDGIYKMLYLAVRKGLIKAAGIEAHL